jgi:glycine hydroxymethyltransferase
MMAAKAVAMQEASQPEFAQYAQRIVDNAQSLAEALRGQGVSLLTGGTDNHLVMLNVSKYGVNGRQAEAALRAANLTCNRNVLPNDPNGAWYTSGLRLGTPALTTLGMGAEEMREVAAILHLVLSHTQPSRTDSGQSLAKFVTDDKAVTEARARVAQLLSRHRLYPELDLE